MSGTEGHGASDSHTDDGQLAGPSKRDVEEDAQQAEDAQIYATIQASLKTATEEENQRVENRQRERKVGLAEKAEHCIAKEQEKRQYAALGLPDDSDEEDLELQFDDGDEVDDPNAAGSGIVDAIRPEYGQKGLEMSSRKGKGRLSLAEGPEAMDIQDEHVCPASTSGIAASARPYACAMCERVFVHADALNEHRLEHFND